MPIHNEVTDHAHFCIGPSITEPEHAERCSIPYQLQRVARGLQPNWGNNDIQYGYDKMDNSLTDHKIALDKTVEELKGSDLTEIPDELFNELSPSAKAVLFEQREKQKNVKLRKKQNDEQNLKQTTNSNSANTQAQNTSAGSTLPDEKPSADSTNTQGRNPKS